MEAEEKLKDLTEIDSKNGVEYSDRKKTELDEIKRLKQLAADRQKEIEELKAVVVVKKEFNERDPAVIAEIEAEKQKKNEVTKHKSQ